MATINHRDTITLTNAAVSITLPATDPYDLYEIVTTAAVAIPGTTAITASGTVTEGLTYNFRYLADVSSGTVTIMGEVIPPQLRNKSMLITAFYDGSAWVVDFFPDLAQTGIISKSNLIESYGTNVVAETYTGVSTAGVVGEQILSTAVIPANTLAGTTTNEAFRITAWGTCNSAVNKLLTLRVVTGGTTHTLFKNNNQDLQGVFKIEAIVTATPPGVYQSEAILVGGDQNSTGYLASGINWDYTVAQNAEFVAVEQSAGGINTVNNIVPGTAYVSAASGVPTIGGTGSGCTVGYTAVAGGVTVVTISNAGSGYTVGDIITINAGNADATFTVVTLDTPTGGVVTLRQLRVEQIKG